MTTESVKYFIDAEDKATAKFVAFGNTVDSEIKKFRKIEDRTRGVVDRVNSLTSTLGFPDLSPYTDQVFEMTDAVNQFSKMSKKGLASNLLFTGGVAAAVGVMAFKFGNAIGEMIFDIEDQKQHLAELRTAFEEDGSRAVEAFARRWKNAREDIGILVDPDKQTGSINRLGQQMDTELTGVLSSIESFEKKIKEAQEAGKVRFKSSMIANPTAGLVDAGLQFGKNKITQSERDQEIETYKAQLAESKKRLAVLREQRQEVTEQTSERRRNLNAAIEQRKVDESSANQIRQLNESLKLAQATGDDRIRLQLRLNGVKDEELDKAVEIKKQVDAIKESEAKRSAAEAEALRKSKSAAQELIDAQKKADAGRLKAIKKEESARQRVRDVVTSTAQSLKEQVIAITKGETAAASFRLQMQGVSVGVADQIADIQKQVEKVTGQKGKSSIPTSANIATDDRGGTGRSAGRFQAKAADIEAKKQTQLAMQGNALLERLATILDNQEPVQVLQRGR